MKLMATLTNEDEEPSHELKGKAMGTTWSLKCAGEPDADLENAIGLRLAELEAAGRFIGG